MNRKSLIIKFLVIVAVISSAFVLSSCFTTIGLVSCKKSCQESCNSSTEDNMSGHEYGVYYELSADGESYLVSEVGYSETSVIIPESYEGKPVTGIRRGAFSHAVYGSGCSGTYTFGMTLSSLTLPSTIKTIEVGVFPSGYTYNYHVEVGTCNKLIFKGTLEDWLKIEFGSKPLNGCSEFYINGAKVTDLVIPETVTTINENAFAFYRGLKSVTLHENITVIEDCAFLNCTNLEEISFPCTDLTVGASAFAGCEQLKKVTFTGGKVVLENGLFSDCVQLEEIEWNTVDVARIPAYAFYDCYGLKSFVIPASVTEIDFNAFTGCNNLVEVYNLSKLNVVAGADTHGGVAKYAGVVHTAEEDNSTIMTVGDYKFVVSEESATLFKYTGEGGALNLPVLDGGKTYAVRSETFYGNDAILSVNIPVCVTEIGDYAFDNCENLKVVTGCEGILKIGVAAFQCCESLESVALGKVEDIGERAFIHCDALTSLSLPETVTKIDAGAFSYCGNLKTLSLPKSLKSVGLGAFDYNYATITYAGTQEEWLTVELAAGATTAATVTCSDGVWEGKI